MRWKAGEQPRIAKICFCIYLIVLVYYLLFNQRDYLEKGYNLIPFAEISRYIRYRSNVGAKLVAVNLGGNILGFLPFGYLLPGMAKCFRNGIRVVICCFLFSLCVEGMQLMCNVGCFDVDDILLNTTGGLLGYGIYFCVDYVRRKNSASKKETTK